MFKPFSSIFNTLNLAPTEVASNPGELTKEETIDFLSQDDDKEEPLKLDEDKKDDKEKPEGEEEKDEELSELEEIEEELEEPDDEELELTTPVSKREILKKFPTLFKDFPYLEKAYYRERQFTEVFPTPGEAKEAAEKVEALDKYEADLKSGNIATSLQIIKQENPNAFAKAVDGLIDTIGEIDSKARNHIIGNLIKSTIMTMVEESKRTSNEGLEAAAVLLNQFVFGTSTFTGPSKLAPDEQPKENEEQKRLNEERQQYINERFTEARDNLNTKVNNTIRATIDAHIDPKESMGDYVKRAATNQAFERLVDLIDQDKRFSVLLDRLWDNAFRNKFSRESLDKIRSAYLAKAKSVMPGVIKSTRVEALRGIGKRVREEDTEKDEKSGESTTPKRTRSVPEERERKGGTNPKSVPRGMSSYEFLMQD